MSKILRTMIAAFVGLAALAGAALGQEAAQPRRLALLVGATDYPREVLPSNQKELKGPKNDVTLMHRTLVEFGVPASNIRVLADALETADYPVKIVADGPPTRAAILAELQRLVETARTGDQIIVYLTGHGSSVPEADKPNGRTEADGRDETYLPLNIGPWKADQTVGNQILDDELGEPLTVLINRGAFVWFIVDACHSGTAVRSAGSNDLVTRYVDPASLGVPAQSVTPDLTPSVAGLPPRLEPPMSLGAVGRTGFVAFYAAHPAQRALEGPVPPRGAGEKKWHGLMTWYLIQALRSGQTASYETIAQRVLAGYWEWGGRTPTPMFDGDLAARPVLGQGGERTFRIEARGSDLVLRGGLIDDVGDGTIVAVLQQNAPEAKPLFYARVTQAAMETSLLERLPGTPDWPERLTETLASEKLGADVWLRDRAPSLGAQIVQKVPAIVLRVSPPAASEPAEAAAVERAAAVLKELASRPAERQATALDVVDPAASADLRMTIAKGRVWFTPDAAPLVVDGPLQAYSLGLSEIDPDRLGAALRQIARARNLTRMAEAFSATPIARSMKVRVALAPSSPSPATGKCAPHPNYEPGRLPDDAKLIADLGYASVDFIRIGDCDRVYIVIENVSSDHLDVTPLYVDPWSQIGFLGSFRDSAFGGLRLAPRETRIVSYTENTASTPKENNPVGYGRVLLIAVKGDPNAPFASDFRHLTGKLPLSQRRDASTPPKFRGLLDAMAFGSGAVRAPPSDRFGNDAGVVSVPFETVAPGAER